MNEAQKQNYNQTEVTHIRKYMDIISIKKPRELRGVF